MTPIRIESRQNASLNGCKVTEFEVFESRENGYVFAGAYCYLGKHNATEEECLTAYVAAQDFLNGKEEA